MAKLSSEHVPLPDAVEQLIKKICREQKQEPPDADVRQKLALLSEEAALVILRKISACVIKKSLSAFIVYMIKKESPQGLSPVSPLHTPSPPSSHMFSPPQGLREASQKKETWSPVQRKQWPLFRGWLCAKIWVLLTSFWKVMPRWLMHYWLGNEMEAESAVSPKLAAWGELEFRKAFLILSYIGENQLEDIDDISADEIRSLKHLRMLDFEESVWESLGKKYIDKEDRLMTPDWDAEKTHLYHCHVSLDGKYRFKGPYLEKTKTHLQRVLGDENVLAVKFADVASRGPFSLDNYSMYHKIAREGIRVGSRRYFFFVFKDGGKEEKKKNPTSSPVKCYFIRMESNATIDQSEYILSRKTIYEARSLFMHAHHGLPSVTSFMARFSLILSKTVKLDVDLASVNIEDIEDVLCRDRDGKIVYDKDDKPRIHTDGTGFISEDLALLCPHNFYKGEQIRDEHIERSSNPGELAGKLLAMMKQPESQTREPPLLIQFRLFNNGCAIKGTVLVNKKLPPSTIQVRPSMVKVCTDPKLSNIRTVNSFEIVGTSNKPKRTFLSRYLIALLSYGGVPKEYFTDIVINALRDAHGVFSDKRAALKVSVCHGDIDDFSAARMILSGIPLDETFLQHWLSKLMKEEKRSLGGGKLPVPESYYLMGTADPTGILESDEVCVILDNGQISGKVLVYRNPGLHFGDIHVLKATYVKALESFIGNAKYAIFFSCKGPRSLADEIAGGDFDGDMYWVSRNPQLLEYYKGSEPWTPMQNVPNHNVHDKKPSDFSAEKLEEELFKLFLTTRFQPSYAKSVAADSWLALMDRLLSLGENCIEEKDHVKAKILQLIDIYYDALDAPKKGGRKVEVPEELKADLFPHYMERDNFYISTSILGVIYDTVKSYQSEDPSVKEIRKLPCFDVEVPKACLNKWKEHYDQYRQEMTNALCNGDEGKNEAAEEVIKKYKKILYGTAEFEESKRGMEKDQEEIFNEALAIYHITYDFAKSKESARYCGFAWRVAGPALLEYHAMKKGQKAIVCLPSVLREIFN